MKKEGRGEQQIGLANTDTNLDDPNFDRKLDLIIAGAKPFLKEHLLTRISKENCIVIIAYILAMQTEINPSERYRIDTIHKLKHLAEFHRPKSFSEMTRQDILDYLDRLRKPEQVDPLHRWVGSYELTRDTSSGAVFMILFSYCIYL